MAGWSSPPHRWPPFQLARKDISTCGPASTWLRSSLQWTPGASIAITSAPAGEATPLARVHLDGAAASITAVVNPGQKCLAASVDGLDGSARIVPLGGGTLASLIGEELGVRTRDLAFERALLSALEIQA